MALTINKSITTKSGFTVPSGVYIWLVISFGADKKYSVEVRPLFFKDKSSFDSGDDTFAPKGMDQKLSLTKVFTPSGFAPITILDVHKFVKKELEDMLGAGMVTITE